MKFLRGMVGFCIAAILINGLWGIFTNYFGVFGGWIVAFVITGTMWFMNHHLGLIENEKNDAFIDMGLGIAICSLMRDTFKHGVVGLVSSIPTFVFIAIGAVSAGVIAGLIEKNIVKKRNKDKIAKIEESKVLNV